MTKNDSTTKKKILDAAQSLMLTKGFVATTIDEICEAAGFTKGSFFHYFESKEHLGKAVLDHYWQSLQQLMRQDAFLEEMDPLDRVYGFVDFVATDFSKNPLFESSCLIGNLAQELSITHPQIRMVCADYLSQQAGLIKQFLDEAKIKYAPEEDFDTQSLADSLMALIQGSLVLAKAKQDRDLVERTLGHFKAYLKCLFGK